MIEITARMVREVWVRTGADSRTCKLALLFNKGNVELAVKYIEENYLDCDSE
jgi:translation elongation factor EF-Ts